MGARCRSGGNRIILGFGMITRITYKERSLEAAGVRQGEKKAAMGMERSRWFKRYLGAELMESE